MVENKISDFQKSQQQANRIRSLSQGPNRSRAELLARKQQLVAANGPPTQLGWAGQAGAKKPITSDTHPELDSLAAMRLANQEKEYEDNQGDYGSDGEEDQGELQDELNSAGASTSNGLDGRRSSRSRMRGSNTRGLSAEAKLESLSEQLKFHQVASANWPNLDHDIMQSAQNASQQQSTNQQQHQQQMSPTNIENVYILLAKKDKDLQLAAELGKVLLEKNDELSKANELQAEQYSRKLELLEEEKHKLRLRLEQLEADYENRLIDVQTDCRLLEGKLDQQRQETGRREREKSRLIDELGQQSQRLSAELAEATRSEQLLAAQVEQLKERLGARGSQRQDQDVQVEALKSEIEIISQRKQDLERRLRLATDERSQLSGALEESGERLHQVESLLCERDARLREADSELAELRDATGWLSGQLDSMIALNERLASHPNNNLVGSLSSGGPLEGLGELELEAASRRSQLIDQLRELRMRSRTRTKASQIKLQLGGQRRLTGGPKRARSAGGKKRPGSAGSASDGQSSDGEQVETPATAIGFEGRATLAGSIYKLLRQFQAQLEQRRAELNWRQQQLKASTITDNNLQSASLSETGGTSAPPTTTTTSNSNTSAAARTAPTGSSSSGSNTVFSNSHSAGADDSGISAYDDNNSSTSSDEPKTIDETDEPSDPSENQENLSDPTRWQSMLTEIRLLVEDLPCKTCHIMINEGQKHDRLSRDFARISDELKRCEEQRLELTGQKTELEAKLGALEELCSTLKSDLESGHQQPDEIVRLAWKRRDEAVSRKNACEIALAKSRIENMQLSSQLMEVVQQKSRLAQQVAQFEDDMHYMTQYSVKAKFSWEEQAERLRRDKQAQQQQASIGVAGISLGPLSSLLGSFGGATAGSPANIGLKSASSNQANATSDDKTQPETDKISSGASIMRNFATSRLKLTRLWSNNKVPPQQQAVTAPNTPT